MTDIKLDLDRVDEVAVHHGTATVDYPRTRLSDVLEAIVEFFGKLFSWIWLPLMLLVVVNVVLRYIIGTNYIAMEEMQWHLYAVGFMIALSFCAVRDGHVRVDVFAERCSPRTRAWFEFFGLVLFLIPFCYVVLLYGYPFVERSFRINEVSAAPGGLPHRWIIKSVILLAFALLTCAAVARLARVSSYLTGFPRPRT